MTSEVLPLPDAPTSATVSPGAIEQAAAAAHALDFIRALPQGLDTPVGEQGVRLSGGQRQRIAIARALVHRPAILILDEATSALDAETEARVIENLARLNCTRIVLAHRLSTIMKSDLIVVMSYGEIVEAGSHNELIARGGHYKKLLATQLGEGPS